MAEITLVRKRMGMTFTGSPNGNGNEADKRARDSTTLYVVVPLNELTLIVVK